MTPFSLDPPVRADEQLALCIAERLADELRHAEHHINVEVQNRVVILEGVVASERLRELVSRVAWETAGTLDVCNVLAVGSAPDR